MNNMVWQHYNPVKVYSGVGSLRKVADVLPKGNILLVTTNGFVRRGVVSRILELVGKNTITVYDNVVPNPELESLDAIKNLYKNINFSFIIALGGGSVLDSAKVLSLILVSDIEKPLHSVFRENEQCVWKHNIPVIAIPTTSGTGAEVTPFATVWDTITNNKFSLSNQYIYPSIAILDPELTLTLPIQETLYAALDAISHAMESLWNKNATPVSVLYANEALSKATIGLPIVLQDPTHIEQRSNLQFASYMAGIAISQTRTAIAHSLSYPLTYKLGIPHGLACSFTLVAMYKYILKKDQSIIKDKQSFENVITLLQSLNLKDYISKYASLPQIENLIDEMYNPTRADNFILQLGGDDILDIIFESFK